MPILGKAVQTTGNLESGGSRRSPERENWQYWSDERI